jgi:hypothetical protein
MVDASVYSNGSLKLYSSPCNCQRKRKTNCIFVIIAKCIFRTILMVEKGYSFMLGVYLLLK